jgi:hypothetical protein
METTSMQFAASSACQSRAITGGETSTAAWKRRTPNVSRGSRKNGTLKPLVAETELEKTALRELAELSRPAYRRLLKGATTADPNRALRDWLRGYAKKHPRWGCRGSYHDARGEGWPIKIHSIMDKHAR